MWSEAVRNLLVLGFVGIKFRLVRPSRGGSEAKSSTWIFRAQRSTRT